MVSLRFAATAVTSALLLIGPSVAHSMKRDPVDYASLVENPVIKTPSHRVHSHSSFDLTFTLHNGQQKFRLQLEPNLDILHDSFEVTHLGKDGKVHRKRKIDRADHKVYKGDVYIERTGHTGWANAGWARIVVHRDGLQPLFEGTFRVDGDHHHVQTGDHYQQLKHDDDPFMDDDPNLMVVWRDSDIQSWAKKHPELKRSASTGHSCHADSLDFNTKFHELRDEAHDFGTVSPRALFGRQSIDGGSSGGNGAGVNLADTIGSVDGCPTTRKVALVGIATDCTYTKAFNGSEDALRKNIIQQVNSASQVYEASFNISLAIKNLYISPQDCPGTASSSAPWNVGCSDDVTLGDRLSLFSKWRGQSEDSNAYWTLFSTCNTDSAVGLAWLGQVCRAGSSEGSDGTGKNETIAAANVVVRTSAEWQVFAHETGHTFGAVHDCTGDACPAAQGRQSCCPLSRSACDANGRFLMNPSAADRISTFSPCSIGNICSGFKRNIKSDCLTDNKNVETFVGSQCGNGIVESGEDCDCGGEIGCGANSCCDANTCKFKTGAVCDPTNEDCCTSSCQFASAGVVCRASTGDCDPQETCAGDSPTCPTDQHTPDGDSCGSNGNLKCASGQCTSRDLQCKNMFGNMTSDSDTTKACSSSGCLLSCKSPDFGFNTCANLNQNFLDGTSCSGGGKCHNGNCEGASAVREIGDWFSDHKAIAIPVGAVIGGLILLAILSCIISCCRRRRRPKQQPQMASTWPQQYSRGANPNIPPPPPGYYNPVQGQGNQGQNQWQRGRSMRYA